MNKKNVIVKMGTYGIIGLAIAPVAIRLTKKVTGYATVKLTELVQNRRIKEGLEDGTIVEIDGEYFLAAEGSE